MKKSALFILVLMTLFAFSQAYAAETTVATAKEAVATAETAVNTAETAVTAPTAKEIVAVESAAAEKGAETVAAPVAQTPISPAETAAEEPTDEAKTTENLEFVSGEIASADEGAKTISVKLYGENEAATADKTVTIKVDENTDITDGEKDRDFKSLTAGTEIDVEYDPVSNKATYIFVY